MPWSRNRGDLREDLGSRSWSPYHILRNHRFWHLHQAFHLSDSHTIMTEPTTPPNPYEASIASGPNNTARSLVLSVLCGSVGVVCGGFAIGKLLMLVGFYAGSFIHGFGQRPPIGFVVIGGLSGVLIGSFMGGFAGLRIRRGWRPRLIPVTIVCLVDTLMTMGTIDFSREVTLDVVTRPALVGLVFGCLLGVIIDVLFWSRPELDDNTRCS